MIEFTVDYADLADFLGEPFARRFHLFNPLICWEIKRTLINKERAYEKIYHFLGFDFNSFILAFS